MGRRTISQILDFQKRAGIKPQGLFAIYAELKREHPDWDDGQLREAAGPIIQERERIRLAVASSG